MDVGPRVGRTNLKGGVMVINHLGELGSDLGMKTILAGTALHQDCAVCPRTQLLNRRQSPKRSGPPERLQSLRRRRCHCNEQDGTETVQHRKVTAALELGYNMYVCCMCVGGCF